MKLPPLEPGRSARLAALRSTVPAAVNAPSTLPHDIDTKQAVYARVARQAPRALKVRQALAYAKTLIAFYRHGVANVWQNHKQCRLLQRQFALTRVTARGAEATRPGPFDSVTFEMAQHLYNKRVEALLQHDMAKRHDAAAPFALSRPQYQLLRRTPRDFFKLPAFALIFLVFVETTPLVCYAFPEITPLTCVLPSILPRLWNGGASKELRRLKAERLGGAEGAAAGESGAGESGAAKNGAAKNGAAVTAMVASSGSAGGTAASVRPGSSRAASAAGAAAASAADTAPLETAYNLPLAEVRALCRALRLISKYVPVALAPEAVLRRRLQRHYNYLCVDDLYLAAEGAVHSLSRQELVNACLERNLILDIKHTATLLHTDAVYDELRAHLVRWLMDAPVSNVGLLGYNNL